MTRVGGAGGRGAWRPRLARVPPANVVARSPSAIAIEWLARDFEKFPERDLVLVHGDTDAEYRKRVAMILPRLGRAPLEAAPVGAEKSPPPSGVR